MIGVCIPAHNEEAYIDACLASVARASIHPGLGGEEVLIVVVHDACTDRTALHVKKWGVIELHVGFRNVGLARDAGARFLLQTGVRWLAFTDADSEVSEMWLVHQLSLGKQVVCGTVQVIDWSSHGVFADQARAAFLKSYCDQDGHRHVHGANLGIDAEVYEQIGGFEALACSEDQALVDELVLSGASIAWSALPRVTTSARLVSRVEGGFATTLRRAWKQGFDHS
ncbi:MAG TPA: glycosyltransferase [Azoarcus sp.]|nr:glycosyltransferase [Azoarcus sp.]